MKYFTLYNGGYVRPKDPKHHYYWIDVNQLNDTLIERSPMLLHLCHKNWFTKEMFFDLLKFSQKKFPNTDYNELIFKAVEIFYHADLFNGNNLDRLLWLRDTVDSFSYPKPKRNG